MEIKFNPHDMTPFQLKATAVFLQELSNEHAKQATPGQCRCTDERMCAPCYTGQGECEAAQTTEQPQPEVGENTGSAAPDVSSGEPAVSDAGAEAAATADEAPAATVKRTRRTKAEMEAAKAAESGNAQAAGSPDTSESEAQSSAGDSGQAADPAPLTIDDVRAALQRYTAANSMPLGIALLKNYGAGRISELREDQYALFIAECDGAEA